LSDESEKILNKIRENSKNESSFDFPGIFFVFLNFPKQVSPSFPATPRNNSTTTVYSAFMQALKLFIARRVVYFEVIMNSLVHSKIEITEVESKFVGLVLVE
jgi:hypothetical protein